MSEKQKEIVVQIPVRCVSCGYPSQFGATVFAEVKAGTNEDEVQKTWKCPICGCEKKIQFYRKKMDETKISRFMIQQQQKPRGELTPGQVEKMDSAE